jgi:hypothetical protein
MSKLPSTLTPLIFNQKCFWKCFLLKLCRRIFLNVFMLMVRTNKLTTLRVALTWTCYCLKTNKWLKEK